MADKRPSNSRRRGVLRATWRGVRTILGFIICVPCFAAKKGKRRNNKVRPVSDSSVPRVIEAQPITDVVAVKAEEQEDIPEENDPIRDFLHQIIEDACLLSATRTLNVATSHAAKNLEFLAKGIVDNAITGAVKTLQLEKIESLGSNSTTSWECGDVFDIVAKNSDNGEKFIEEMNVLLLYEAAKFKATRGLLEERGEWIPTPL